MKRRPAFLALTICTAALAVAACDHKPAPAATDAASAPASAPSGMAASPAPAAPATPTVPARKVSEDTPLYEFDYGYPSSAASIPALRDLLEKDLAAQRATLSSEAKDAKKDAATHDFPFNPFSYSVDWKVVTDLPGWLSLSTIVGTFSGGAHPNYVFDSILWDKAAGKRRKAEDLFTSQAALSAAIRKPFCAELNRQRAKKRGEPVPAGSTEMFEECIDPAKQTVILGSAGRQGFDRVGVLVAPYEAGPYAEGDYEVTLPVTPAVAAAVKPEYRGAFQVR